MHDWLSGSLRLCTCIHCAGGTFDMSDQVLLFALAATAVFGGFFTFSGYENAVFHNIALRAVCIAASFAAGYIAGQS
jgi:hypothetical protein